MTTARFSNNIQDLIGKDYEYLTDKEGNIIASFYEGNLFTDCLVTFVANSEKTIATL